MLKISFLCVCVLILNIVLVVASVEFVDASIKNKQQTFIFVRHGQTDWQGQKDPSLNSVGQQEIKSLAQLLTKTSFNHCFTSDLKRAVETVTILMNGGVVVPVKDHRLRERSYGVLEGVSAEEFKKATDQELATVETREAFIKRITAFLSDLSQSEYAGNVLIVTHGGWIRNVLALCYNIPLDCADTTIVNNGAFFKAHFSNNELVVDELSGIVLAIKP